MIDNSKNKEFTVKIRIEVCKLMPANLKCYEMVKFEQILMNFFYFHGL